MLDPVTVSVLTHRFEAIVQEMGEAMLRTAYSQILNSSRDFSTAICDASARLVAQAEHVPIHVGAIPWAVESVRDFFQGKIRPGDVYLLNDPYHGNNHLPDLTAFVPVFDEYGPKTVAGAVDEILDGAERQARECVRSWTDGVYHGETILDDDGHGTTDIWIRATVTKKGDALTVDLSDSHRQVQGFINSSFPNTMSAVHMAFAYLIEPRTPKNSGTFRPVKVIARQGTIVWPYPPAPVTLATNHCAQDIAEAIIKALAPACPERAIAGWGRRFRIAIKGVDPRTKRPFIWHMFHARPGGGASAVGDGWETAGEGQAAGGIKFGSVEVAEARFPLTFEHHEFRADSAGDGQHRGGVGAVLRLRVDIAEPGVANTAGDGVRHTTYGLFGGKDGLPHRYRLLSKGKAPRVLKTKEVGIVVRPGDVFHVESSGGGGYGPPSKRSRAARAADFDNGFVSRRG